MNLICFLKLFFYYHMRIGPQTGGAVMGIWSAVMGPELILIIIFDKFYSFNLNHGTRGYL